MNLKMKTLVSLVLSLLIICIVLTSCVQNNVGITLLENGGGSVTYSYKVNKAIVDKYFKVLPNCLDSAAVENVNGEAYYCGTSTVSAASDAELAQAITNLALFNEPSLQIFSAANVADNQISITTKENFIPEDIKVLVTAEGINIYEYITLKLDISTPYEITEYSEGTLSSDKRNLKISIDDFTQSRTLKVSCFVPDYTPIIVTVITLVTVALITIIAVVFIKHRKRKLAEAMPNIPVDKNPS